jgi:hypothetical protein
VLTALRHIRIEPLLSTGNVEVTAGPGEHCQEGERLDQIGGQETEREQNVVPVAMSTLTLRSAAA